MTHSLCLLSHCDSSRLKYLLSAPSQEKFANPAKRGSQKKSLGCFDALVSRFTLASLNHDFKGFLSSSFLNNVLSAI